MVSQLLLPGRGADCQNVPVKLLHLMRLAADSAEASMATGCFPFPEPA